jgi:hypothetical protein
MKYKNDNYFDNGKMVSYFKVTLELEKGRKEGRIEECI